MKIFSGDWKLSVIDNNWPSGVGTEILDCIKNAGFHVSFAPV